MNKLRIVFMGTPEFALASLAALVKNKYNVVGVVTAADKPAGRGRALRESAVKKYAVSKGITILQPPNLKNQYFLDALAALEADVQVVVAFRMLPKVVWQMPKFGTFNLHASLLPQYRGAAPINWAIINGEEQTGLTTFFIDEKIDTGAMILQESVDIGPEDTAGDLHDRLMKQGSHLVMKTIDLITAGDTIPVLQPEDGVLKSAPKLNPDNCRIDWNRRVYHIYNIIRGLSPYPAAWSMLQNGNDQFRIKILRAEKEITDHEDEIGSIERSKSGLKIAAPDGYIIPLEVQLEGKRKMDIKSFLNGFELHSDAKML